MPCWRWSAKLNFRCSALAGVSGSLMQRLQSVLNATARLVFSARRSEHTTSLLRELHWLKFPERTQYWLCVLAFRCLHGLAPSYLSDILHLSTDVDARRRLRSASASTLVLPSTHRSTLGDLEFLATQCSVYVVAGFLLSASKDSPVRCVISSLTLNVILGLSFCTVLLQQFLWQRHLNHIHSFIYLFIHSFVHLFGSHTSLARLNTSQIDRCDVAW